MKFFVSQDQVKDNKELVELTEAGLISTDTTKHEVTKLLLDEVAKIDTLSTTEALNNMSVVITKVNDIVSAEDEDPKQSIIMLSSLIYNSALRDETIRKQLKDIKDANLSISFEFEPDEFLTKTNKKSFQAAYEQNEGNDTALAEAILNSVNIKVPSLDALKEAVSAEQIQLFSTNVPASMVVLKKFLTA